jgi:predicted nucleic acid-binding Zn ribbon protein
MLRYKERASRRRQCVVCGQMKPLFPNERMCDACRLLTAAERNVRRRRRKATRSVWAMSGGLPSLGKRR